MHARALPDRRLRDAGSAGRSHSVQGARHVRSPVGEDLGRVLRERHGRAEGRDRPRFQVSRLFQVQTNFRRGFATMHRALDMTIRFTAALIGAVALGAAVPASAHHSYAMYDGSVYKVFTGVIVRIVPNAAHFEMHFVPLNETRDALVRDEKGEQLVWVVQMESAAEAFQHGIT